MLQVERVIVMINNPHQGQDDAVEDPLRDDNGGCISHLDPDTVEFMDPDGFPSCLTRCYCPREQTREDHIHRMGETDPVAKSPGEDRDSYSPENQREYPQADGKSEEGEVECEDITNRLIGKGRCKYKYNNGKAEQNDQSKKGA